ncbi:glycoside hydrolase family 16 protein [Paracoccus shanxieyensis]|uniref:Family 16 glycosylhydrolase n=1 Tax=Paracoccus shanxieyensis TaxID=2675752 RepID=A0A6L6J2X3_9RHOB|nr:family 16 glycosylhydrolase [Paracoccus shanxieyensis]MTH65087.1 family 16 glycosylhydrolase [Paracoccus shanxieyensis]MTH88231.1 family 16 glycosylhydrolase [Paracoccus shanxieyensis]
MFMIAFSKNPTAPAISLLVALAGSTAHAQQQSPQPPDLSGFELIFRDDFDAAGLNAYRNGKGLWSTSSRRDDIMTNGPKSVFLSDATTTQDGGPVGIDPLRLADGRLRIGAGVIPDDKRALVQSALANVGRSDQADKVRYYTGMVSLADTWAQAYGYYEITARIPEGKGHWPAFWLAPAGIGWPPEIDIFEAYSRGVGGRPTPNDDKFSVASFFDRLDLQGNPTQAVDFTNPFDLDADGNPAAPMVKTHQQGEQFIFQDIVNARQKFGADMHAEDWTWAAAWTPEKITFYFGRDHDSLIPFYSTPVPPDLTTPMYVIINDQISSHWGWDPVRGLDHLTFADGNEFSIESVSVYALHPDRELRGEGDGATIIDDTRASRISGTDGRDVIVTGGGAGQDFVALGGGADVLHVMRGTGNVIVSDFGSDDHIVLEGFHFDGPQGAMARLTQVGGDVWLANGAYPADPQTVIFRNTRVEDIRPEQLVVRWSVTPDRTASLTVSNEPLADAQGSGHVHATARDMKLTDAGSSAEQVVLQGDAGDQEYRVSRRNTQIVEQPQGGVDSVVAMAGFALPANVENITAAQGARGLELTGNDQDNRIESNAKGNRLRGGPGNDLIISHGGPDWIVHAAGDGDDVVEGFTPQSRILLEGHPATDPAQIMARLHAEGGQVVLDLGAGGSITFRDTVLADFTPQNFLLRNSGGDWGQGQGLPFLRPQPAGVPE